MKISEKRVHLGDFRERYVKLGRKEKGLVIDEACALLGWDRKHAIKALNGKACKGGVRKPYRREKIYGEDIKEVVLAIWKAGGRPCGPRLRSMIPLWLDGYESFKGSLDIGQRRKLLTCSERTLQNITASEKSGNPRYKHTNFRLNSRRLRSLPDLLGSQWEPEITDWKTKGTSPNHAGDTGEIFLRSLTLTDTLSGWRELAEILEPGVNPETECVNRILGSLPFKLTGFDGGRNSEFVHETLGSWLDYGMTAAHSPSSQMGSMPDAENDEIDTLANPPAPDQIGFRELELLITDLYRSSWLPLRNHFTTVTKAVEKVQVGSIWKKRYDQPASPYQRLLASGYLDPTTELKLREEHLRLDPFQLTQEVGQKLRLINRVVEQLRLPQVP